MNKELYKKDLNKKIKSITTTSPLVITFDDDTSITMYDYLGRKTF